jgi:hypothetical protein
VFEMNARYATVIGLDQALDYVRSVGAKAPLRV